MTTETLKSLIFCEAFSCRFGSLDEINICLYKSESRKTIRKISTGELDWCRQTSSREGGAGRAAADRLQGHPPREADGTGSVLRGSGPAAGLWSFTLSVSLPQQVPVCTSAEPSTSNWNILTVPVRKCPHSVVVPDQHQCLGTISVNVCCCKQTVSDPNLMDKTHFKLKSKTFVQRRRKSCTKLYAKPQNRSSCSGADLPLGKVRRLPGDLNTLGAPSWSKIHFMSNYYLKVL